MSMFANYIEIDTDWGAGKLLLLKSEIIGIIANDGDILTITLRSAPPINIYAHNPTDEMAKIVSELGWS